MILVAVTSLLMEGDLINCFALLSASLKVDMCSKVASSSHNIMQVKYACIVSHFVLKDLKLREMKTTYQYLIISIGYFSSQ